MPESHAHPVESERMAKKKRPGAKGAPAKPSPTPKSGVKATGAQPSDPKRLEQQIRDLDAKLVDQLNRRAKLRARLDRAQGRGETADAWLKPVADAPAKSVLRGAQGPLTADTLRALFRQIDHACQALTHPISVGYLGPEFSYSHLASLDRFGEQVALTPLPRIATVFDEVSAGRLDYGIVPLENSTDGRIADTLAMLARLEVQICGEVPMCIHHQLLGSGPRSGINTVCSKPQALSQCRGWLAKNLPQAELVEASSTTMAAERAARDPHVAAVASAAAGQHYGLKTLAANIEDQADNVTRFAVIGLEAGPKTGVDKTALLVQLSHEPGALADAMGVFKRHRLNMTWIESFPMPSRPSEYLFFFEFEGYRRDLRVRKAIQALQKKAQKIDLLGSYGSR